MTNYSFLKRSKKAFKYSFTLIELIVVIVVIGILASIVVPNISSFKQEAEITAVISNQKNLQTAVDMYTMKNFGKYPVEATPFIGVSSPVDFRELYPDYVRTLPETKGYKYWVDYKGKVWYSTIDSPTGVSLDTSTKELSWDKEEGAVTHGIYKVEEGVTSKTGIARLTFVKEVTGVSTIVDSTGTYAVSSHDKNGFETPPATSEYKGYPENADYLMPFAPAPSGSSNEGSHVEEDSTQTPIIVEEPKEAGPIAWHGLDATALDKDPNTFSGTFNEFITWDGDLSRRVVHFDVQNRYSNGGYIYILDENGNNLTFYDTNNKIMTRQNFYDRTQFSLVIPKGAKSIRIVKSNSSAIIYDIHVDEDSTFPDPITNLEITPNVVSNELTWNNPTDSDFKNVAIFRDGLFVGVSSTGTFTDKPLFANTTYKYELESADLVGTRSTRVSKEATTLPREIYWSGIGAAAFDFDDTTVEKLPAGQIITWEGDLTDRTIELDMEDKYSNGAGVFFKDVNGANLIYQNATTGQQVTSIRIYNRTKVFLVVPAGATKLVIVGSTSHAKIYSLHESNDLIVPNPVSNIQATEGYHSVTLSWTPPTDSDYQKAAIFREGVFVAYSAGNSYTDLPLFTGQSYNYEIKAIDTSGNQSSKVSKTITTLKRSIVWSGLDAGGFDGNPVTSAIHLKTGSTINWTGDLIGKTVDFDLESPSVNGAFVYVKDINGVSLPFVNTTSGLTATSAKAYRRTNFSIIIPENAAYIQITVSGNNAVIYDIIDR